MDSRAGAVLGTQVGRLILGLAGSADPVRPMPEFDPAAVAEEDFRFDQARTVIEAPGQGEPLTVMPDALVRWMWAQCRSEFALGAGN